MDYRGKSFMNPDKRMAGVPDSVKVATPQALTKPIGMPSTRSTGTGSGNPMAAIRSRSQGRDGGS